MPRIQISEQDMVQMQALMAKVVRGPQKDIFKLSQPFKSSPTAPFNDRFTVSVAFGTGTLTWTLLLNAFEPRAPPDLVLDVGNEDCISYKDLISLDTWDAADDSALLRLLAEARDLYRSTQVRKALDFSSGALQFELVSLNGISSSCEMRLGEDGVTECTVPLYSGGEGDEVGGEDGELLCRLCILFGPGESVKTSLVYPEDVGAGEQVECPPWQWGTTHAVDFVPFVAATVRNRTNGKRLRKELVDAMCRLHVPLEVDKVSNMSAAFLFQDSDGDMGGSAWDTIVHVSAPPGFPTQMPIVELQTVSHFMGGRPLTQRIQGYPYSPRWTPSEIASRITQAISSSLPAFRDFVMARMSGQLPGAAGAISSWNQPSAV